MVVIMCAWAFDSDEEEIPVVIRHHGAEMAIAKVRATQIRHALLLASTTSSSIGDAEKGGFPDSQKH